MTLSLAGRSQKTQKIRVLPQVGKDPEAHRSEMIKVSWDARLGSGRPPFPNQQSVLSSRLYIFWYKRRESYTNMVCAASYTAGGHNSLQ